MAKGYAQDLKTLESRFNANWSTTVISWQNVDDPAIPPANTAWVEFSVLHGGSNNIGFGAEAQLHRLAGIIDIGIFVPKGTGLRTAVMYADTIAAIFRDWEDETSGIVCRSPYINVVGQSGEYEQVTVTIPFGRDATF
jgi:hypothetical protein